MKFISWNIDSLNAALTSDSNRAVMSRDVLKTIISEDADVICLQETKLPRTNSLTNPIPWFSEPDRSNRACDANLLTNSSVVGLSSTV